jgi:hypothetical protein
MSTDRNRAVIAWTLALLAPGALFALLASFAWTPEAIAGGGPLALAGIERAPCPGCPLCGMSRAFCALSHLRLGDALDFNPGALLLYPLAWVVAIAGPSLLAARFFRR